MAGTPPQEFSSWKEIASRLGISVRTAQLWEKERGLPVRRVPGKRSRVHLRAEELEAWLATTSVEPDGSQQAPAAGATGSGNFRGRLGAVVPAIVVAVLAVVAVTVGRGWLPGAGEQPGAPARFAFGEDVLIALDALDAELWRLPLPGLRERPYQDAEGRWAPLMGDLDGDGSAEILMTVLFEDTSRSGELLCLSADGTERWRFVLTGTVATAQERFDETYTIAATEFVRRRDGTVGIAYSAHHAVFYPSRIGLLDADGELIGEYWHPGHLGNAPARLLAWDLDGDGADELLVGGVNNARDQAALVILAPESMAGAASARPEYQFQGLETGVELATLFFPPSALNRPDNRFNVVSSLRMGSTSLFVGVDELPAESGGALLLYELDPADLSLIEVAPSDYFLLRYGQALEAGTLAESFEVESTRLEGLFGARGAQR